MQRVTLGVERGLLLGASPPSQSASHDDADGAAEDLDGGGSVGNAFAAGPATHKDDGGGYHHVINLERDPRWDYDGNFRMAS